MVRTLKNGELITIEKQFRNESNNYKENSKIYADLFRCRDKNNKVMIVCETEIQEL